MLHRISAGAIVEHEGRVLLVRHRRPGHYDFWVAPGGGVQGEEPLEAAASREVREETGLDVAISKLIYVEELVNPECRHIKFWFAAQPVAGMLDTTHPDTVAEFIVEAAWLSPAEMSGKTVFPPVLTGRFWRDRLAGFPDVAYLPLRRMEFW